MRSTIQRILLVVIIGSACGASWGYARGTGERGLPSMTPNAAPVPRAAPNGDVIVRPKPNATPSPRPAGG
jgi:hypothetical protein